MLKVKTFKSTIFKDHRGLYWTSWEKKKHRLNFNHDKFSVSKKDAGNRLDLILVKRISSLTRSQLKKVIKSKNVKVNDEIVSSPSKKIKLNESIFVNLFQKENNKIEFIQDLPLIQMKNQEEKKMNKNNLLSFWPYLSPESCISFRKSFVKNFKKKNRKLENDFKDVWFGFRLGVFAYFVNKSFYSLEKNLTIYKSYGESKKYNTFNFNWFNRRLNSFNYLKKVSQNKINFNLNFDYVITRFILSIFKILK